MLNELIYSHCVDCIFFSVLLEGIQKFFLLPIWIPNCISDILSPIIKLWQFLSCKCSLLRASKYIPVWGFVSWESWIYRGLIPIPFCWYWYAFLDEIYGLYKVRCTIPHTLCIIFSIYAFTSSKTEMGIWCISFWSNAQPDWLVTMITKIVCQDCSFHWAIFCNPSTTPGKNCIYSCQFFWEPKYKSLSYVSVPSLSTKSRVYFII